jgi:hypothetical protein
VKPQLHQRATDPGGESPILLSPSFQQVVKFTPGDDALSIRNYELPPGASASVAGSFESTTYDYATSYAITDVKGRQAYELYIAGVQPNGTSVIEKWVNAVVPGGYYATRSTSNTPIGVAVSGFPTVTVGIQGGTYVPASQRLRPGKQTRTLLWSSQSITGIRCLACDPEGRFLLFVAGDSLYQLSLVQHPQASVLYSAPQYPHLSIVDVMAPAQPLALGRLYNLLCLTSGPDEISMMFDPDNDGVPNGFQTLSGDAYVAAGYDQMAQATNFIINH